MDIDFKIFNETLSIFTVQLLTSFAKPISGGECSKVEFYSNIAKGR